MSQKSKKVKIQLSSNEAKPYQELFRKYHVKNHATKNAVSVYNSYFEINLQVETDSIWHRNQIVKVRWRFKFRNAQRHLEKSSLRLFSICWYNYAEWLFERGLVLYCLQVGRSLSEAQKWDDPGETEYWISFTFREDRWTSGAGSEVSS